MVQLWRWNAMDWLVNCNDVSSDSIADFSQLSDEDFADVVYEYLTTREEADLDELAATMGWSKLQTFEAGWVPDGGWEGGWDHDERSAREELEEALSQMPFF